MELQGCFPASSVVDVENVPYLLTEKGSLVFTFAPNGHIWGHRVDDGGTKRDVELEVYAPIAGMYTLRRRHAHASSWNHENDLTEGQKRAIRFVLSQKALCKVLGSLVLPYDWVRFLRVRYTERNQLSVGSRCNVLNAGGSNSSKLKLADCLLHGQVSRLGFFGIEYLDDKFTFQIGSGASVANVILLKFGPGGGSTDFNKASPDTLSELYKNGYNFFERGSTTEFPHYVVSAAQSQCKKFFVGHFPACVERHLFPNEITVLCDTENIFDVFQIDDALLLLEEKRVSETESELYWTIAVTKNKAVGELNRILSNNQGALNI